MVHFYSLIFKHFPPNFAGFCHIFLQWPKFEECPFFIFEFGKYSSRVCSLASCCPALHLSQRCFLFVFQLVKLIFIQTSRCCLSEAVSSYTCHNLSLNILDTPLFIPFIQFTEEMEFKTDPCSLYFYSNVHANAPMSPRNVVNKAIQMLEKRL